MMDLEEKHHNKVVNCDHELETRKAASDSIVDIICKKCDGCWQVIPEPATVIWE